MPSTLATGNPPATGDTPGDPGRGGGRGGRGGGWGKHGHWRNKSKRGNSAAPPAERNAEQQNLGGDGHEHTRVSGNNNRGRGGASNWSTQATAGRGRGRGGYQGGRGGGNGNFGHLPPPPGIPNRWQALEPSPAPDDQNGEGQDTGEQGATSGNGNGVQGWHSGDGGRDSGRGWFGRGRSSPSLRGRGSSPMPPPDDTRVRNWVEFQARGRGSSVPSGRGSRPDTPGEHRGRGRGGYDRGRGNWDGGRGGWDGGSGRGRGDRGRGAGDRGRGSWGRDRGNFERGRGHGQDRGRGGYGNDNPRWEAFNNTRNAPPVPEQLPPPRDIMEGVLVPALQQLAPPAIEPSDKPISLKDFKCVGSYTWVEGRDPVIVVPGAPRQWQDRPLPIQVRFDRCIRMLDENAYRMSSASPLIPLFRAVDAFDQADGEDGARIADALAQAEKDPEPVNWRDVDFVTDRNNLRKFARWIRTSHLNQTSPAAATDSDNLAVEPAGESGPDEAGPTPPNDTSPTPTSTTLPEAEWDTRQDFRIDLRLGGDKTILMERWAVCAREHVAPPKGGCRDNFVREATLNAPECEKGGGHYRIVQYDLDGLKMVVRWEVDARAPNFAASSSSPNTSSESGSGQLPSVPPTPVDIEELARWDDTPTSGAAAWGAPEPAGSASVDIDELAKWDDNTVDQAAAWGALPVPTDTTSATSPIGQDSPNNNDKNNDFDAFAIWETPEDDPAAAAAAWGAPTSQPSQSAASAWGPPPSLGGAAQDAPTSTGGITKPEPPKELRVVRAGTLLPQGAVAELATRSVQYVDRTSNEDTFLQMFLTQTPLNLVAVHTRGSFDRVIRQELDAPEFAKFNEDADMMHTVQQLVALLRQVQELVKEYGKGAKLSLVCEKGNLALYGRGEEEEDPLLANELARFEG